MRTSVLLLLLVTAACSREAPRDAHTAEDERPQQQVIVDRASSAVTHIRSQPRFASMEPLLAQARAVLVFPKLIKASMIFGGEGGNGVMLVRHKDGSWSSPAFYSLGAPSVGLQAGFRESTAILLIMNDHTLDTLLHSSLTVEAQTSATLGQKGERGINEGEVLNKDIYVVTEAGGAFAGFSLDGYVIAARKEHNRAYYDGVIDPRTILFDRNRSHHGAAELQRALATTSATSSETPVQSGPAEHGGADPSDTRACSPESRQAASCTDESEPVCATSSKPTRQWRTVANACEACRDPHVEGYRPGKCPDP